MAQVSNTQQRQEVERALFEVDQGANTLAALKFEPNALFFLIQKMISSDTF